MKQKKIQEKKQGFFKLDSPSDTEDSTGPNNLEAWLQIGEIRLMQKHRTILRNRDWLDDALINAGQILLKAQYPEIDSLQSTILAQKLAMIPSVSEFVQILHVQGNHWICISAIGGENDEVQVYDNLNYELSLNIKKVIAHIMQSPGKRIKIKYMNVQHQTDSYDCGLFALAFCTSFCYGKNPMDENYDQQGIRNACQVCCMPSLRPAKFSVCQVCPTTPTLSTPSLINVYGNSVQNIQNI